MYMILAPSKTQTISPQQSKEFTLPLFDEKTKKLVRELKKLSREELGSLMHIGEKLAQQNHQRYQQFGEPVIDKNSCQALFAFQGDVYTKLGAETFNEQQINFCQNHLRILSGLYGLLRPLDLMQPYRLEMGLKWQTSLWKNLYSFWKEELTEKVNRECLEIDATCLINLASQEYIKVLDKKRLAPTLITPVFKEQVGEKLKSVAIYAKHARGSMANYIVKGGLKNPDDLKAFGRDGYVFSKAHSTASEFVFLRQAQG